MTVVHTESGPRKLSLIDCLIDFNGMSTRLGLFYNQDVGESRFLYFIYIYCFVVSKQFFCPQSY